jgi:hypothetical protein
MRSLLNGALEPSRLITIGFTFSPYPSIPTDLSTNTLYRAIYCSTDTIYCGVFNEMSTVKVLILINKKRASLKIKSILVGLISDENKMMKIAKMLLNLLAFL